MSFISARVEASALIKKLNRMADEAVAPVAALVRKTAGDVREEMVRLVATPVQGVKGNRKAGVRGVRAGRSRAGQPPRKDTGRLQQSIRVKHVSRTKSYVTVDAADKQGRRYPWMLESGTKTVGKRPYAKKAQRKFKKVFQRELLEVVRRIVR